MSALDPTRYGPVIAELLEGERLPALGPGSPNTSARRLLSQLDLDTAFAPHRIGDRDMARACHAGLWLLHDYLDESHCISQEIHTPTGSFWHAVMHRREPDAWNSKYWWRKVGSHPVLQQLAKQTPALGYQFTDPFAFVDFVERVRDTGSADEETARKVQRLEWELLFDWGYRQAIG